MNVTLREVVRGRKTRLQSESRVSGSLQVERLADVSKSELGAMYVSDLERSRDLTKAHLCVTSGV